MNSLDPLKRINEQALDLAKVHTDLSKEEALDSFREMLNVVGLQESRLSDYPHQFSGGMQQRVMIAFALFLDPKLVIADEPTTALDVIMQDQIFKYLDEIRGETDISMLLITHDISLVFESCDEITIMHSGQVAEEGSVSDVYKSPHHPYSILLQNAFPDIRYPDRELSVIEGIPPKTMGSVERCTFANRCPWSTDKCREAAPELEEVTGSDGAVHRVSCFHNETVYQDYLEQSIPTLENQTK